MRASNAVARHKAKKAVMKQARGYYLGRNSQYRHALAATKRAEQQAFVSRKQKKRNFRQLWISRINIAVRQHDMTYSRFIAALNKLDIRLDRKQLSELAIHQPDAFAQLVEQAKAA